MFTLVFWKATFERALATALVVFLGAYGADTAQWLQVDHLHTAEFAGLTFLLTVAKCLIAAALSDGTPSFGSSETLNVGPSALDKAVDDILTKIENYLPDLVKYHVAIANPPAPTVTAAPIPAAPVIPPSTDIAAQAVESPSTALPDSEGGPASSTLGRHAAV
jgi:hypothetical protein